MWGFPMPPREAGDQSLREQVAEALGDAHSENRDPDIEINFSSLADAAIAASGVEGLQRSNDGLLDAIERLNGTQDRLRVENEQLRQLLDLPVGEQRAAPAAYCEHEQGEREELRAALAAAADDLDKAANQFASMRESQKAGHNVQIESNPEKFAEKAARARRAASSVPVGGAPRDDQNDDEYALAEARGFTDEELRVLARLMDWALATESTPGALHSSYAKIADELGRRLVDKPGANSAASTKPSSSGAAPKGEQEGPELGFERFAQAYEGTCPGCGVHGKWTPQFRCAACSKTYVNLRPVLPSPPPDRSAHEKFRVRLAKTGEPLASQSTEHPGRAALPEEDKGDG